jgi:cobalamin synthase
MNDGSDPRINIGICSFIVAVCAAVLWETRKIGPGVFEPLGSAPVPRWTAALIILLCLLVMAQAVFALRRREKHAGMGDIEEDAIRPRWRDAGVVFLLTVLYVTVMQARLTTFAIMTTVFLFIAIGLLVRFERRRLPLILLIAAVTGFGCQYLFTRVFIVDLPGL